MQTNSYADWTRLPLERGVCADPSIWTGDVGTAAVSPGPRRAQARRRPRRRATIEASAETVRREFVNEEKLRILKMLEDGKIDAEKAVQLMDALDRADSRPSERELKKK